MRKTRGIIYLASIGVAGAILALINPLYAVTLIGIFTLLTIARQLNFQKMLAMMRQFAKNITRLQLEIRAKLHTGYTQSFDNEETHRRTSSLIR
ncbi:MAG: hypothetical protein ACQCN6_01320 [Candidatus Bathyarchaeia archaeon]|jgi:hypothetical protein